MEMDTDSLHIAFARDTIDECVKPEMLERWGEEKWKWFSKVYTGWGSINKKGESYAKTSCKGAQQKRNKLLKEHFLDVQSTTNPHLVENAGFVRDTKNGCTKTYTQTKIGTNYIYAKRKVLADGVTTTHLDI